MARTYFPGRSPQESQRARAEVTRLQESQRGRHFAPHFGQPVRWVLGPRRPMRSIQYTCPQGLLGAQKYRTKYFLAIILFDFE